MKAIDERKIILKTSAKKFSDISINPNTGEIHANISFYSTVYERIKYSLLLLKIQECSKFLAYTYRGKLAYNKESNKYYCNLRCSCQRDITLHFELLA